MTPTLSTPDKLVNRATRRDRETELWQRWMASGKQDQQALGELFQSLAPLIRKLSMSLQGNLPGAFIEGEIKKQTLKALETWNPALSQMNTHITNQATKVLREVYKFQNPTRLAEESHLKVPVFQNVRTNLREQLGYEPTSLDIAREMNIGVTEAQRLMAGARRDMSIVDGGAKWKPTEDQKMSEILDLIQYELNAQQRQVLERTFGRGTFAGQQQSTAQIAAAMGLPPTEISQLKNEIGAKIQHHFGAHKLALN